jgi:DNA repair exonuclease SbcCD ATPase subunit
MSLSYLCEGIESVTDSKYFSGGSASLAWLCLRLALHSRLSEGNPLPLILDEATVYFDERRLQLLLAELTKTAASGKQIILLSASERELRYLNNASVTRLT